MKASDFRKFYLTFVNLYGVIFSEDAYKIMKHYFPELKKKDLYKDLKDRNDKLTRRYAVLRTSDRKVPYIICDWFLSDKDIDEILEQQGNKPFFYCEDLEEYFSYADSLGYNPGYQPMVDYAYNRLKKKNDKKEAKVLAKLLVDRTCLTLHLDHGHPMKTFNETVQRLIDVLEPEDIDEANRMIELYTELQSNTRMITNRGYSLKEMHNILPKADPGELTIQIGDNMKNSMLDDEMDVDEFIEQIKNAENMPDKMRDDLIRQLEDVKLLKKNKAKA